MNIFNDFGEYRFLAEQVSPNTLKLTSYLAVTCEMVQVDKTGMVKTNFDKIEQNSHSLLWFVKVD